MVNEQKIRSLLFYLSLSIFLIGLPIILSFALGYKLDTRTFRFTKTGLISLKTQPQGAEIYLDGRLLNEKTPYTIIELLPGKYNIRLELKGHYPWIGEVTVRAGKVIRQEKIILFPLRPDIKQLNKERVSSFWADTDKGEVYYFDTEDGAIYKSDPEGGFFEFLGNVAEILSPAAKWKVSLDRQKLVYFNYRKAMVINLSPGGLSYVPPVVLDYPRKKIIDIFWHSDSYHLIVVTDSDIEVLEAKPEAIAVSLVNLNKRNTVAFYDEKRNILYFTDSQRAEDGKLYENVYKLDLSVRLFQF